MKKALTLALFLMLTLSFTGCSKTPEKTGDAFLKASGKATDEKRKEELEKKAYLKYSEAIQWSAMRNSEPTAELKIKYLNLTLKKLNRELARFLENSEAANVEQLDLWRADFQKFLPGLTDKELIDGYSKFLISIANPDLMEMNAVIATLKEAEKLGLRAKEAQDKLSAIRGQFSGGKLGEAETILNETVAALKAKKGGKDALVTAEYWTLMTLKYDPNNAKAQDMIKKIRELMLDTYSGYERYEETLAPLDPSIDKYDIYLCLPEKKITKDVAKLSVSLWNLTASPVEVLNENFSLITDGGDTVQADPKESRYNKITVDTKTDTTATLVFKLGGTKGEIKNLLYKDGSKISEKFFR